MVHGHLAGQVGGLIFIPAVTVLWRPRCSGKLGLDRVQDTGSVADIETSSPRLDSFDDDVRDKDWDNDPN